MSLLTRLFSSEKLREHPEGEVVIPAPAHWYFCLLRCADGTLYADIAQDAKLFAQECNGGARKIAYLSHAGRLPAFLAFTEEFMSERAAKDRLFAVQAMSREKKERLVSAAGLERIRM